MYSLLKYSCALLALDSVAGMSEAMMREAKEKIDFWDHLDYASISAHRNSVTSATCSSGTAGGYACSNVDLQSFTSLENIGCGSYNNDEVTAGYANDIWGWTSPSGQEIAIVGCSTGTSFVDITNPSNPSFVGFIDRNGPASYWSDMKVYGGYVYIASESSGSGIQIFDLSTVAADASDGLTAQDYTGAASVYSGVSKTHNLEVNEESGYLYVLGAYGGSDSCGGGLLVLDVVNPANPVFSTCYTGADYVHDAHCVMYHGPDAAYQGREVCMTFSEDKVVMLDVTLKCDIQLISSSTYGQTAYTHQGWFSEDHAYFTLGDEMDEQNFGVNTRTLFWDATSLANPVVMEDYRATTTSIDHNMYNVNKYIFQSNYCGGLHILNGSIPVPLTAGDSVQEVGFFDMGSSCSGAGAPWLGSWSNYPFFHSGNVAVASIEQGLFVLRPQFYGSGAVSVAPPAPTITRSVCVPTAAPTSPPTVAATSPPTVAVSIMPTPPPVPAVSVVPSVSPTVTSTTSDLCVTFVVSMTDSWGDGWNGNYLFFDEPENMQTTTRKVTLPSGHSGSATLCYPPGSYSPFACGGSWKNEVGWTIEGYGISGGAGSCQPSPGNTFVLLADGQTVPPTSAPTPSPTISPTSAPTECPTERTVTVHMSDSYGDGWNGNYLYFDNAASMTTTEYKMTFWSGYSKTKSICLPAGTYSPFACGGGWPYECSWVIEGRGISGGASQSCTPNSGSFTVSDGGGGGGGCSCCHEKIDQVLSNQDTMMGVFSTSSADTAEDSTDTEATVPSEVAVDAVALIVGTVLFAGVFTGTVAMAFFNRERYLALDAAYSTGESSARSLA